MTIEHRKTLQYPDRVADQTQGNATVWEYEVVRSTFKMTAIRRGIREATPDADTLRRWASDGKPPQRWFDETSDPFSSAE